MSNSSHGIGRCNRFDVASSSSDQFLDHVDNHIGVAVATADFLSGQLTNAWSRSFSLTPGSSAICKSWSGIRYQVFIAGHPGNELHADTLASDISMGVGDFPRRFAG